MFAGLRGEDVEEWLDTYARVSAFDRWDDHAKLQNVSWSLNEVAKTVSVTSQASPSSFEDFRLLHSSLRRLKEKARGLYRAGSRDLHLVPRGCPCALLLC